MFHVKRCVAVKNVSRETSENKKEMFHVKHLFLIKTQSETF